MEFYNNEPYLGIVLLGIIIAMEEERAIKGNEVVPAEAISSIKAGLMGPLASIGDTVNQGIIYTLFLAIGVSLTLDSGLGAWGLSYPLFYGWRMAVESIFMINLGYNLAVPP